MEEAVVAVEETDETVPTTGGMKKERKGGEEGREEGGEEEGEEEGKEEEPCIIPPINLP